jgi:L-Ala-D/L-Glu epimerase
VIKIVVCVTHLHYKSNISSKSNKKNLTKKIYFYPMTIKTIKIYKYSIPMHAFTIATGTMDYAQNILIQIFTDKGITGIGECSAFPMIVGETQNTCYEMAKDFAQLWKNKNPLAIDERMQELHLFTAGNSTIKSAFDMALFDIASQHANMPLYKFLGGAKKDMLTDITVGIATPTIMAMQAKQFVEDGATILKVKLGKDIATDIERIKAIREAIGNNIIIRIDANQGWSNADAIKCLQELGVYNIEFCEQPMRTYNDDYLPELIKNSPIKIMADESVYNHHDAIRVIKNNACNYINIKMAKSGGILEAQKIIEVAKQNNIPCMMGGMLESRVALTAFAHFAAANDQIIFYDMDTCMLGHKIDPVIAGVTIDKFIVKLPNSIGIGASVEDKFLENCESIIIY